MLVIRRAAKTSDIVIHPESLVHSLVAYLDGSVIAQLSHPDMRTPIAYALSYPERIDAGVTALDLIKIGQLNFEALDPVRFPCVKLAYAAVAAGGTAPALLNAANEIAVAAFLRKELPFTGIFDVIAATMDQIPREPIADIADVLSADAKAREAAHKFVSNRALKPVKLGALH
jgi:1-deoxy-D-xylulose-5-phosphate reductoisomerase